MYTNSAAPNSPSSSKWACARRWGVCLNESLSQFRKMPCSPPLHSWHCNCVIFSGSTGRVAIYYYSLQAPIILVTNNLISRAYDCWKMDDSYGDDQLKRIFLRGWLSSFPIVSLSSCRLCSWSLNRFRSCSCSSGSTPKFLSSPSCPHSSPV